MEIETNPMSEPCQIKKPTLQHLSKEVIFIISALTGGHFDCKVILIFLTVTFV